LLTGLSCLFNLLISVVISEIFATTFQLFQVAEPLLLASVAVDPLNNNLLFSGKKAI
jgi:hypothetical protein